jgi:serine/threonine protein kinase
LFEYDSLLFAACESRFANSSIIVQRDIKIFDFGLAKELTETTHQGRHNLTEMLGSLATWLLNWPMPSHYNATCSLFLHILLWEMLSLKTPYELYTPKSLREKVYNGAHKRPPINVDWSVPVKLLLRKGWTPDLHDRSTMGAIVTILRKECVRARDGDDSGLEHNRRRSTFVFRPNAGRR